MRIWSTRRSLLSPAVIVAAAAVYTATAAKYVLGGDNGEFAALFAVGGVAHPPGYPLYVLWLRAFRWLPALSPAHGAALATAIAGVASLVMLDRAVRAWGASDGVAALTVAVYAFSVRAWILATHAEVFALNALIALSILWAVQAPSLSGWRRAALVSMLVGLGMANHHTIILLAPIAIYGVGRGVREDSAPGRALALALLAATLGMTPYLYMVAIARSPGEHIVWGDPSTFRGLLFHIRRGQYGTTRLALRGGQADSIGQLALLAKDLVRDLIGLPLVALGVALVKRPRPPAGPLATGLLLASCLLVGPLFVAQFNLQTSGLDRAVVERFHLLPAAVLAVLMAPYLEVLGRKLFERHLVSVLATASVAVAIALASAPEIVDHHGPAVELYVRNTLGFVPSDAIILGTTDPRLGGFMYAKYALKLRRDVTYVDAYMLLTDWYRRQMGALGLPVTVLHVSSIATADAAAALLTTRRPLFMTSAFSPATQQAFPTYPVGTLLRVLPAGRAPPDPATLAAMNEDTFSHFALPADNSRTDTWGGEVQASYVTPWLALAEAFDALGAGKAADAYRRRARLLEPRPGTGL